MSDVSRRVRPQLAASVVLASPGKMLRKVGATALGSTVAGSCALYALDPVTAKRSWVFYSELAPVVVEYRLLESKQAMRKKWNSFQNPARDAAEWEQLHEKHAKPVVACMRRMLGSYAPRGARHTRRGASSESRSWGSRAITSVHEPCLGWTRPSKEERRSARGRGARLWDAMDRSAPLWGDLPVVPPLGEARAVPRTPAGHLPADVDERAADARDGRAGAGDGFSAARNSTRIFNDTSS